MKQVNYYPVAAGWSRMWTAFAPDTIDADFARIAALGADSVRIFVQPSVFGFPLPNVTMQNRLSTVVAMADTHGLTVHLTLFDLFSSVTNIAGSKAWAKAMLDPFNGESEVAVIEVRNEVDPSNGPLMTWTKALLPYVKQLVPGKRVTVSIADKGPVAFQQLVTGLAASPPDLWSYHYYGAAVDAVQTFTDLKQIAGAVPLFIGETGQSTYGHTDLNVQANYLTYISEACQATGLGPPSVWTLNDFTTGQGLTPSQCEFGLFRANGVAKPSAAAVKAMFA